MSLMEIKSAVSDLDERERANLAAWLLDSLPSPGIEAGAGDVLEEARKRSKQLESGEVKEMSEEEFWSAVDSDLSECE